MSEKLCTRRKQIETRTQNPIGTVEHFLPCSREQCSMWDNEYGCCSELSRNMAFVKMLPRITGALIVLAGGVDAST
jgi:hypothetical protein